MKWGQRCLEIIQHLLKSLFIDNKTNLVIYQCKYIINVEDLNILSYLYIMSIYEY